MTRSYLLEEVYKRQISFIILVLLLHLIAGKPGDKMDFKKLTNTAG